MFERLQAYFQAAQENLVPISEFDGISIFHSDSIVMFRLGIQNEVALLTLILDDGHHAVIVNSAFLKIPVELQEAALASEVSHIHLGHHTIPQDVSSEDAYMQLELRADFRALNHYKKDIKGFLKYLLENRKSLTQDQQVTIQERIDKVTLIQ